MGIIRERRLNCRLYVDRRADAEVLKKLDRLIAERHFLNQTELIKHGIELAYEEAYGQEKVVQNTVMSGEEVQALAEAVAGELKQEIQQILARGSNSIGERTSREDISYVPEVIANVNTQAKEERESDEVEEPVLPGGAFGFLQSLNND